MQASQMQQYQQVTKLYKQLVDSITTLQLPQLKLYILNLQKRISAKAEPILADYLSVKQLLDTTKQAKGKVPLHFASASGHLNILRYLIDDIKLDYKIKDKQGNNPYFTAIEHGYLDIVKYFIQQLNCSANQTKDGEISALHLAANHNHVDILIYLLAKGADIQKVSIFGKPINWAVGGRSHEATKTLLDHGASPDGDSSGTNIAPIILAVDFKDIQIYEMLIQKGANAHAKDPNGYSLLHLAAEKGEIEIVKDLIKRGADYNLQIEGKTPLYLAFQHSKWEVVNFLKQQIPNSQIIQNKWKAQNQKLKQAEVQPNKERAQQIKNNGNKYYVAQQYEQALSEYLKAIAYDSQNQVIHRNIAACYLALKQYELALLHCKQAKKVNPKNVKTVYRQSQAFIGLNNLIDAASSMWQCCLIEPGNQQFRLQFQRLVDSAKQQHNKQAQPSP